MSEKDQKVRKQWLAILVLLPLLSLSYNGHYFTHDPSMDIFPVWYKYTLASLVMFIPLLFNYILYRCAYKKPGTKLLTVLFFLAPLSLAAGIWAYVSGKAPMPSNPLLWSYTWVSYGLTVLWWVLNWKMRKINKQLQRVFSRVALENRK